MTKTAVGPAAGVRRQLNLVRLKRIAGRLNTEGRANTVGTYMAGSFQSEVLFMDLPQTGIKIYLHEVESGGTRVSVKTAREIDLNPKGLRAIPHHECTADYQRLFPEYPVYKKDHSRFSFLYSGDPGDLLGRLVVAAADSDPAYGESLASWHERRQISDTNCFKRDAAEQSALFDRLRAAALRHDPRSVCGVVGFHREQNIALPVVSLILRGLGLHFWIANDFSSTAVTVESSKPLEFDPQALGLDFSRMGRAGFNIFHLASVPFHGDYAADRQKFSFHLAGRQFLPVIDALIKAAK